METRKTFYLYTKASFKGCRRPSREPDYVSLDRDKNISSEYWYTDKGVYRDSRHWSAIYQNGEEVSIPGAAFVCGKVASCYWSLKFSKKTTCGFCPWEKFKNNF